MSRSWQKKSSRRASRRWVKDSLGEVASYSSIRGVSGRHTVVWGCWTGWVDRNERPTHTHTHTHADATIWSELGKLYLWRGHRALAGMRT